MGAAGLGEAAGRAAVVETVQEAEARFLPFWESAKSKSGFASVMPWGFQESQERYQTWRARVRGVCVSSPGAETPPGSRGAPPAPAPTSTRITGHSTQHLPSQAQVSGINRMSVHERRVHQTPAASLSSFQGNEFSPCPFHATY